jgi:zinc protease
MKALLISCWFSLIQIMVWGQSGLPTGFYQTFLTNGLEVLVIEDPMVPIVTLEIAVRNGSYTEDSSFNGLSHLYEHMFFKANKDLPSQDAFMERANELGVLWNGGTSEERVNYFIILGKQNLEPGLQFVNTAIRYPLFLKQEMENENPVVDGEFQRKEANPYYELYRTFGYKMWGDNYYRKNPIGLHNVILTATPEKMNFIKSKYYHPNNSILVIAGDVHYQEVMPMVEKIYGSWEASDFDPFEKWPIPEFQPLEGETKFLTISENARLPRFIVGYHGPDTRNDVNATYAADLFTTMLGLSDSRLSIDLTESGLATMVSTAYYTNKHTGHIRIIMIPNAENMQAAYQTLWRNIDNWASPDYFTEEQLETAKIQLAINQAFETEATSDFVHTITFYWGIASIDYYAHYIERINAVTLKEIQQFASKYIEDQPHVVGLLINSSMRDDDKLKEMGFTEY